MSTTTHAYYSELEAHSHPPLSRWLFVVSALLFVFASTFIFAQSDQNGTYSTDSDTPNVQNNKSIFSQYIIQPGYSGTPEAYLNSNGELELGNITIYIDNTGGSSISYRFGMTLNVETSGQLISDGAACAGLSGFNLPADYRGFVNIDCSGAVITGGQPYEKITEWQITGTPNSGGNNLRYDGFTTSHWAGGDCYNFSANCGSLIDHQFNIEILSFGGWNFTPSEKAPLDTTTRIIELRPENGTTTSNPVTLEMDYYISPDDIGSWFSVEVDLRLIDQNVFLVSFLSPSDLNLIDHIYATSSGLFNYSTTTTVGEGNYRLRGRLQRSYLGGWIDTPFLYIDNRSVQFIVGTSTFIGNIAQNSYAQANALFNNLQATSTETLANSCRPFSGEFSVPECLAFLFIPDQGYLNNTLETFKEDASTRFPLGYITDFIAIVSTTTESSLPIIDATIPNGIPGHGSNITLKLNGILDQFLYATTSMSTSASSTQTLFDITNYYWKIIIYIMTALYIFGRVAGMHLIPKLKI